MPQTTTVSDAPVMPPPWEDPAQPLAIVGLVRDGADTVAEDVRRLAAAMPPFGRIRWYVVESDSSDRTLDVLASLKAEIPGFEFCSLGTLRERLPMRTQRIAHCRNRYLDWLRAEDADDAGRGYVVVADLDGMNRRLGAEAMRSCWSRAGRSDWAVCTANQEGLYYDIWALRHPVWCAADCWQEYEFLASRSHNPDLARLAAVYARMIRIDPASEWIEVDSAFGGLAIYRRDALGAGRYEGLGADGSEVCEHVSLHAAIRAGGGRIFINPRLVNADGADMSQYWPERRHIERVTNGLPLRALLRLFYGKQASKEIRRLIRSVA